MPVNLITLPEWEVREWKAGHGLLFGLITDPLTAVVVTAALAEYTAARCARRPPAESKEKTPTSSLDDTESEKIPTNPPVTKKLSDTASHKAQNRKAYERRMEQRRRKEETMLKLKSCKEEAKQKPTPRKLLQPLSRENPPGPDEPVVPHHDDDMFAIADLLGEPQDHYSGSPQRSDESKAILLSNSLKEKTIPPSSLLKKAAGSQTKSLPIRVPPRRHQGLKPENEGLPNSRPKKIIDKNILTERPAPSQNIDKQATEIETADKPANIDKPATANETIEKTTGNGPTHNGNKTASDNNRHGHNNEPVLHHAPGAPSTSSFENPRPEQQANDRIREQAGTTLVGDINQHGISRGLEEIELSLEDLDRGRRFYDEKMWVP